MALCQHVADLSAGSAGCLFRDDLIFRRRGVYSTAMITDDEAYEANREAWDRKVGVHLGAAMYDVPGFLAGLAVTVLVSRLTAGRG